MPTVPLLRCSIPYLLPSSPGFPTLSLHEEEDEEDEEDDKEDEDDDEEEEEEETIVTAAVQLWQNSSKKLSFTFKKQTNKHDTT